MRWLLALGALQHLGSAGASDEAAEVAGGTSKAGALTGLPNGADAQSLILGSKDGAQPQNMEQFLTAVTEDVDAYWTSVFEDSGLPEPAAQRRRIPVWLPARGPGVRPLRAARRSAPATAP